MPTTFSPAAAALAFGTDRPMFFDAGNGMAAAAPVCRCDLKVVSDANTFFIETVLAHHGVLGCFSEIVTNPASVDVDGRLRISPFHDPASAPHGCSLCPDNMCKGKILGRIQATGSDKKRRFIYIGDGKGDYCPSLKLGEGDHVMARENYPLWHLICDNKQLLKAEVHPWNSGEGLEKTLLKLAGGGEVTSPPAQASQFDYSKCEMSNPASCPPSCAALITDQLLVRKY
ncbi:Thiamine phosphate phosphatase-like protein [Zea mays]|uniref:Thiamine phosphate phosphatase-like protein n=1 Tax=Zea mays TaxID=4577 RepID=A0A3L6FBS5_MAIZE|nr:Thiamine phosphate phosphatase-like protein [Zea mays]